MNNNLITWSSLLALTPVPSRLRWILYTSCSGVTLMISTAREGLTRSNIETFTHGAPLQIHALNTHITYTSRKTLKEKNSNNIYICLSHKAQVNKHVHSFIHSFICNSDSLFKSQETLGLNAYLCWWGVVVLTCLGDLRGMTWHRDLIADLHPGLQWNNNTLLIQLNRVCLEPFLSLKGKK